MGYIALPLVLLLSHTSRNGMLSVSCAHWSVFGHSSQKVADTCNRICSVVLVPTTQGAAFHHLRVPSTEYSCRKRLPQNVSLDSIAIY
ncbi:unnamed protein product, partial [Timema podura]|nr:unnamed protein product [Timema podura]